MLVVARGADAPAADEACHPMLLRHQLTTLSAAVELESGPVAVPSEAGGSVSSRMGVLGDKPGSGKSYVVAELAMVVGTGHIPATDTVMATLSAMVSVTRSEHTALTALDLTVIVVPHNITRQWQALLGAYIYADSARAVELCFVTRLADLGAATDAISSAADGGRPPQVMLVSAAYYPSIVACLRANHATAARVVFDEADSLKFASPCNYRSVARFYWFVTASVQNLFPGYSVNGSITVMHSNGGACSVVASRYSRASSSYIRAFFPSHSPEWMQFVARLVVVTDNALVDGAFRLPPPEVNTVRCVAPLYTRVLRGIASAYIVDRLAAGDLDSALSCLRPNRADTEGNIIAAAIAHFENELADARAEMEFVSRRHYATGALASAAAARQSARISEFEQRISNVRDRIVGATECMICYGDISTKTVLPCCNNSFCLACISRWLSTSERAGCPVCKAGVSHTDFMVCREGALERRKDAYVAGGVSFDAEEDKQRNLRTLLSSMAGWPGAAGVRVLFFCDNDYAIENSGSKAMMEAGFRFFELKGNSSVINKRVFEFNFAPGPCALLVNCRFYGCGLNLEKATDIILYHSVDSVMEEQVVGRAQRPPRSAPLRVWRFVENSNLSGGNI